MRPIDWLRLIVLAAIWGASFIFTRELAPELGVFGTAATRALVAGVIMLAYFQATGFKPEWRKHWRLYAVIAAVNSAIPLSLYSFAALHIPASYSAIFNATSSLFGAVFAALWIDERFTTRKAAGLAVGIAGVGLVAGAGGADTNTLFVLSVLACLGAATCYGIASVYARKHGQGVSPFAIAGCHQVIAGIALIPLIPVGSPSPDVTVSLVLNMLALGGLCSAAAHPIYFRLIKDVGPSRALTVTFLIPAFAMLWGSIFLGESITATMLVGTLGIVAGTLLVAGWSRTTVPAPPDPAGAAAATVAGEPQRTPT